MADESRDLSKNPKKITATQSDNFLVFLKPMLMRFFKKHRLELSPDFLFFSRNAMLKGFEGVQYVKKLVFEIPGTDLQ